MPALLVLLEAKQALGTSRSRSAGTNISLGQGDHTPTLNGHLDQLGRELGSPTCTDPAIQTAADVVTVVRIIEAFRLEKTSKMIKSSCQPNATMATKLCL